jgi:glycyl-tRNA synthetase beta chain
MQDTLLIEIFTEELPPKSLQRLSLAFADAVFSGLKQAGFTSENARATTYATPRRLAVAISEVLDRQPDREVERKGPTVSSGLSAEGKPTPALIGFAKSCGVAYEDLQRQADSKGEYFVFRSRKTGAALEDHLSAVAEEAAKKLPVPKMMRWGDGQAQFMRPVHGVVMLHGTKLVPGKLLDVAVGRHTLGHRFLGSGRIEIPHAHDYASLLRDKGKVIASFTERRETIRAALIERSGHDQALWDDALLDEVTALVEWPVVYEGKFDEAFLAVPQECLILSMKQHQKYFPLADSEGGLRSRFLIVSNLATDDPRNIIHGNERVLRARLSDAKFFYDQDRKMKLDVRIARLGDVVYHNKLGSQLQRVQRIQKTAGEIARLLGADAALAERAAHLCKVDLITDMVGEFPELQGVMGMYYARHDGELETVARAIEAHYHPRFANDTLPEDAVAASVALADKLDTLVGIYGIGLTPTGDKDPFGLRRQALGVLRLLAERSLPLDLKDLLGRAASGYPAGVLSSNVAEDLHAFMLDRLRNYLRETGYTSDEIEAVVSQNPTRIDLVPQRIKAVREFKRLPEAQALASANKRIQNILRKTSVPNREPDETLLQEPEERALYSGVAKLAPIVVNQVGEGKYTQALTTLAGLRESVDRFFDKVMVMSDDAILRENRLALLNRLGVLMNQVADLSKLAAQ